MGYVSFKKTSNSFKDLEGSNKQSDEDFPIEGPVKTTIQKFYDLGLFNHYNNADEIKDYLFTERCSDSS